MGGKQLTRRHCLLTAGALGSAGLAGCVGGGSDDSENDSADDDATDDETGDSANGDDNSSTGNGGGNESTDDDEDSGTEQLTATLVTSEGDIEVELYPDRVPNTVENFVGLATGEREWTDPETGETRTDPLYEDVLFHRVIEGFVIQTGDPLGTGRGGPGYTFDDEFHPDLRHDSAGVLSMANRGPDTNGSQFFITLAPQPHLDDKHAVFGEVIDGMDVVETIGSVETDSNDRPVEDVVLESVTVDS